MRKYIGRQLAGGGGHVEVHTPDEVCPLMNRDRRRGGDRRRGQGFGWGGASAGSVSLARAILWDVVGVELGEGIAVIFAGDVLARLPGDAFALDEDEVREWLRAQHDRRLSATELVEHLGAIALADPDDEAEALRGVVDRCWTARSLVN